MSAPDKPDPVKLPPPRPSDMRRPCPACGAEVRWLGEGPRMFGHEAGCPYSATGT